MMFCVFFGSKRLLTIDVKCEDGAQHRVRERRKHGNESMNENQSNPSSQSMNQEEETRICVNMNKAGNMKINTKESKKETEAETKKRKKI